ncbi:JAB domain-containing protein [Pedobacter frigoris]|uniref:JAB domain-containing protein n=1 Tax=Pedobacter frigoris TaxID=2571272 RepID=UPI00292FC564|nr:JAB domain-containing protein [Pedobacter frigoris]
MHQKSHISSFLFNESDSFYYRSKKSSSHQYIAGNSHNTCKIAKEVIGTAKDNWLLLFDDLGTLKHTQKLGNAKAGFGDIKGVLQITLQHQCLSIVLVSHSKKSYTADKTDLLYNIRLISTANSISITLLDHLVISSEGYYSYRDNGLLTYMTD